MTSRVSWLALLLLLPLTGCDGPTEGSGHPMAGSWTGTFVFRAEAGTGWPDTDGTIRMRVEGAGAFSGSVQLRTGATAQDLAGTIDQQGVLRGSLDRFRLQGQLSADGPRRLRGTTTQLLGEDPVGTITFELGRG